MKLIFHKDILKLTDLYLDTVQDFLDMKPYMQDLVEISIFSLNNDTVRHTKIMNNLLKHLKIFKVLKIGRIFPKQISLRILDQETSFIKNI